MSRSTCIPLYPATDGRQTGNNFVADTRNTLTAISGWIQVDTTGDCARPGVDAASNETETTHCYLYSVNQRIVHYGKSMR